MVTGLSSTTAVNSLVEARYNRLMSDLQIKRREYSLQQPFPEMSPLLSRIFAARSVTQPQELQYSLQQLIPPQRLSGIEEAAEMLAEALAAQATILIVGDFDADGATSCALAVKALRAMGGQNINYLVPNRFEFGYGLSPEIVGVAAMQQPDLLVTVDNGISSVAGVHAAQALGMSVIVTDHHLPGETLPTAEVIVNPNMPGDNFPSKNLAGVGVIFYVMLALRTRLRGLGWFEQQNIAEPNMSQFLDIVALGTVADVVKLDANNRVLVQQGLKRIRAGYVCPGIKALLQVSNREPEHISCGDLAFAVAPRLNAAGRLEDMSVGIECLLAEQSASAMALASQLDQLNSERKEVEQSMRLEAFKLVDKLSFATDKKPVAYCLSDAGWHQGVVGLVASRVKEQTQRPVAALAPADGQDPQGEWKGSLRSVEGIHIRDVLVRIDALKPGLMSKFGGHAMAAGLSISGSNIEAFSTAFVDVVTEFTAQRDWSQVVWTDGGLQAEDFSLAVAEQLLYDSPWGQGFPAPVFDGQFEVVEARVVGEVHVKMALRPRQMDRAFDAICFNYMAHHDTLPRGLIEAVFQLDVNHYQGRKQLQLLVQHVL